MKAAMAKVAIPIVVAALALAAGLYLGRTPSDPDAVDIRPLMAVSIADLAGRPRTLTEWRGKVLVVNFWATWCPPCLKEIPEFMRMQERLEAQGVQFVGIAADREDKVREFARNYKINYPILLGQMDVIEIARLAGNRVGGLPFTVVVDRQGRWVHSESGALDEPRLQEILRPLL